uniref:Uncharacterized protein n=1 Tax=Meloidogyne incognita TaxID=6306 RepID=A0A914LV42_MELIC
MNQKWDVDWKMDCINYFKRQPCQDGLFYYQHYAVYRCVDGHKMFQNCVPLNEPHSLAIAINSTLITPHFRSICVQYAPDSVQFLRTHCVEGTRFMKPNTNLEFSNRRVECLFDRNIQTLRKVVVRKRLRRVCRHKKDAKVEENVHYICKNNAYWPDYCVGADALDGSEIQIKFGEQKSDGINYIYECKINKVTTTTTNITTAITTKRSKNKKKKRIPDVVNLGPIKCIHYFNSSSIPTLIEIGHQLEFIEGNVIIYCLNNSGWAKKLLVPLAPQVSVECLYPFGSLNLYSCHGLIYSWSLLSQIELLGCVDPMNLQNWIPLGSNYTNVDSNVLECRKEGLVYVGCKSSTGNYLKIGESEGSPIGGGIGIFEKCEADKGLIKYYEFNCQFDDNVILPGHYFVLPVKGASNLKLRIVCERQRLLLGNELIENLNHKAFWYVLTHKDCIDDYGNIIPLGGYGIYNNITAEFCRPNGVQIEKPIGCKFGSKNLLPREQMVNSQDILECLPNGQLVKIGCYLESLNITMALGQIEPLPKNHNILIQCQINSTGISFTNGVKNCIKEETGEEFLFGSKDEDSDSIRVCTRKSDLSNLHGVWELTHCLFGTIKVPRGSCFFNKTKEEVENNQNNSTCNLNEESKGVYKLCEQNSNFKPIFLDASFEYCSPSQNIKATDLNGQIINTQIEEFKQTSFECNYSDWRPKPLPVELENASEEEEIDEYIDDEEYSEEEEEQELKTAEEIEEVEEEKENKIKKQSKIQNKLMLEEEIGGIRIKDPTLKEVVEEQQNELLEAPKDEENKTETLLLDKIKLENMTTTTLATILTTTKQSLEATTEENKLEATTKENKLEATTEENKLENINLTTQTLKHYISPTSEQTTQQPTTNTNNNIFVLSNETIFEEFEEEIIEELSTIKPNMQEDKNFEQTSSNFKTTQLPTSEFEETFQLDEVREEVKPIQTTTTTNVLLEGYVEEIISEQQQTTTQLPLFLLPTTPETLINKSETSSNVSIVKNNEEEIGDNTKHDKIIITTFFNTVDEKLIPAEVQPIPPPPTFDFNKEIDVLVEFNLEKTLKRKDCEDNEANSKVFECKNRLSEHFCSAFKSMCLFPTGDSAITSVALIHTLHYLRHFIGGGNMRANLRFATNFLETGLAQTFVDRQEINRMIFKIGGLLNLFPSEDDLAELLLSAEGGPIIERMLQLKKESVYQCGISRINCNSPTTNDLLPSSLTINLSKVLNCKRKWQSCLRVANAKLAKEFELLLWHFRAQLLQYPHGAIWLLCSKTCGRCLPVAIADGNIESWKEENPNLIEINK